LRRLILEALEDRILYSAEPVATVAAVSEEFINDDFTFEVNFDNAALPPVGPGDPDNVGYAPFIDITVQEGITVNSANYLGTNANLTLVGTWDAVDGRWEDGSGNAINSHPYGASLEMPPGGSEGDRWYRVDLPFGSFTPEQPVATVVFDATLDEAQGAQVAVPLEITAQGGFRFGNDPLNNPLVDPPLQQADPDIFEITPTVLELSKDLQAPEGETATGPNFTRSYVLTVDVAQGQTITDLNVTDLLPNNIVVTGYTITGGGTYQDNSTVVLGSPGNANQLDIVFDSVTGTASSNEIEIVIEFYVPEFDADGNPVLDPVTGADSIAFNAAEASGTYVPAVGDPMLVTDSGQPNNEVTLQLEALAIQKSVAVIDNGTPGFTLPNDYLAYTLEFQVSDYFSADNLVITDVLSDGQRIDPGTPFTLTLVENGNPLTVDIDPAYVDITLLPDGSQQIVIRLSEFLASQPGWDGTLHGDQYDLDGALGAGSARDAAGDGGTTGTITYRSQIQQNFETTYPSGDQSVDLNDLLTNSVVIAGRVAGTTNAIDDDSGTATQIAPWSSEKQIYAINGDTGYSEAQVAPGDTVTYRIRVTLPAADIENLVVTDFLPLPVFNVGNEFAGVTGVDPYTGIPAAGTVSYGPDNTLYVLPGEDGELGTADDVAIVPTVAVNEAQNQLVFDFGTFNDIAQTGSYTIDLLYTVTATDRPFADGLLLTNQAVISSGTTNNGPQQQTEIQQVLLRQPELALVKGVLDTDSPNEEFTPGNTTGTLPPTFTSGELQDQPIDADVGGLDAGDTVTFAITVTNTGGEDAYDIVLQDSAPPGFVIPSDPNDLELVITRGDGTVLTYSGSALDLFGDGLHVDDLGGSGALGPSGGDGSDVLVVTYKLKVSADVVPGATSTNIAELASFAAIEGGYNFTAGVDPSHFADTAEVAFAGLSVSKTLEDTDQPGTTGSDLTVGEVATFRIAITLPEGEIPGDAVNDIGLVITDQLPTGYEIVPGSIVLHSAGFGGTIAAPGGTPLADGATLTSAGDADTIVINFGEIVTTDDNAGGNNSFSISYQVRVSNDAGLTEGQQLVNTVTADAATDHWEPETDDHTATVVLPEIDVEKAVDVIGPDGDDLVTYTITITNTGSSPSYDTTFSDSVPSTLNDVAIAGAVSSVHGNVASYFQLSGNDVTQSGSGFTLAVGETVTLTVTARVNELEAEHLAIVNEATATGTSLPGDHPDEEYSTTDSDEVSFNLATPTLVKDIVATSSPGTSDADVAIGETVTYNLVITVPEVTTTLKLTDSIPPGMSLVSATVISISSQIEGSALGLGSGPSDVAGNSIVFDFGEVTNESDGNSVADTIVVQVVLRVDNVVANQASDVLTNEATLEYGSGSVSDDADVTVVEPDLEVIKTVAADADGRDAGDTVTYTITIQHTAGSTADAYELSFEDQIPAELTGVTLGGTNAALFEIDGDTLRFVGAPDLAQGSTIVVTVTGTLVDGVTPGQVIANQAEVAWTSLDGDVDGERGGEDGEGGLNDYVASDEVEITIDRVLDVTKEASKATATIGETVDYTITVQLMEGTTENLVVTDVLPPGMAMVGTQAMVSIGGAAATPATVTFDGNDWTLALGTVVIAGADDASDTDLSDNTVVITYTAVVLNVEGNQDGVDLENTATADADDLDAASDDATVEVVEPDVEVIKEVSPTGGLDAGDTVTYTITIQHTADSTADAYDIALSDLLPANFVPGSETGDFAFTGAPAGSFTLSGNSLASNGTVDLAQGSTIVITITGTLNDAVQPGQLIENDVSIAWTSLDGEVDGERDGSGEGPNDYADEDDADLTVDTVFEVEKRLAEGQASTATIGETVRYEVSLTLIEGTTANVVVYDTLPTGLAYDGQGVTLTIGGTTVDVPSGSIVYDEASGLLTVDLGAVVIPGDNDAENNQAVLHYGAVVQNIEANQSGVDLTNTVRAAGEDADGEELEDEAEEEPAVQVIEPDLEVIKEVTPTSGLDAGDTVTYTITIQHTADSTADAYDIAFNDLFPAGVDVTAVTVGGTSGATASNFVINLENYTIVSAAPLHLTHGETIVLTVTAKLTDAVGQNQTIVNEASIAWSSLEGTVDGERDGSGEGPNDYADEDDASLETTEVFDLVKDLASGQAATATIGETVGYQLTLTLIEGTTYGVVVTDDLPDGMALVGTTVMVSIGGGTPQAVTVTPPAPGGELVIDLGDVVIAGDNETGNNTVVITYSTVVLNVEANQAGEARTNSASAEGEDANGDDLSDGDEPDDQETITLVEPDLDIVKTVDDETPEPGQVVTYTVTVTHNAGSSADAMDVVIGDLIGNPNLTLVAGSVAVTGSASGSASVVAGNGAGDTAIQVTLPSLAQGETITITYQATVKADATIIGETLTNTATVDYDTLPGEDHPEERDYEEEDDQDVLVLSPDLVLQKSIDDNVLSPGDSAVYTLAISNVGAEGSNTARNVVVTDVLPLGMSYVSAGNLPPGAAASYDAATRTVTISGFDMDAGDSYAIAITVKIDSPAPAGADYAGQANDETLTNQASIRGDNFEPTPENNEDEVDVTLDADPDLAVTKVANLTTVTTGQQVTYTITVQNLGNQVSTGIVVTDQLDTSVVNFVSASNGGTFDPVTGRVTWTIDSLSPADQPPVFTVVVQVKDTVPAGPDTLNNTVTVADDGQSGPESDTTNNDDDVVIELDATPDLVVDKQVDLVKATQGDSLLYTITVTNAGNQGSTGIVITDSLPPGVTFVSASNGGVYDPSAGTVTWSGLTLAPGETVQVTLQISLPIFYPIGPAVNGVTVADDGDNGADPTPVNNFDEVSTEIFARYVWDMLDDDEEPFGWFPELRPPLLPVDPIYSGTADPGTQIRLVIYSEFGTELASQSVVADTGGNWLASFPGAVIQDRPHEVRVIQDAGLGNSGFLFNFRTYFSPATSPQQFFSEVGGVGSPASYASSDMLDAMIRGFLNPIFQPNPGLYNYEFLPTSSTTTQYAN